MTASLAGAARLLRHGRAGRAGERPAPGSGRLAVLAWRGNQVAGLAYKGSLLVALAAGAGKLVIGLLAWSPFVVTNGLYGLVIGVARFFCLHADDGAQGGLVGQYRRYRGVGVAILIASALYAAYSIRLFTAPDGLRFSQPVAIGLATVVFVELGVTGRTAATSRRDASPLTQAAMLAGLASALTALALVQAALRGVADSPGFAAGGPSSAPDAWGGIFCGACAATVGLFMIVAATRRLHRLAPAPTTASIERNPS
jgi:hypothetical protein